MTKIVGIKSENFLKTKLIELKFDARQGYIEIAGNNGAGKSSLLDAFVNALGGRQPLKEPIRRGETRAEIVVETDRFTVKRIYTASGDRLECRAADGRAVGSPQKMLDDLFSAVSFDPEAFARLKGKEQDGLLKCFLGLDFAKLDAARAELFSERTYVGRQADELRGKANNMPYYEGLPEGEADISSLAAELKDLRQVNETRRQVANDLAAAETRLSAMQKEAAAKQLALTTLQNEIAQLEKDGMGQGNEVLRLRQAAASAAPGNEAREAEIMRALDDAENIRVKLNENRHRQEAARAADEKQAEYAKLTGAIEKIDQEKRELIAAKEMPVAGLQFDPEGEALLFNGLPFPQASSAQKITVSVLAGMAFQPQCKLLLIRNGSLLDDNSRRIVADIAAAHGALVLAEVAGKNSESGIIIEDGQVVEDRRDKVVD